MIESFEIGGTQVAISDFKHHRVTFLQPKEEAQVFQFRTSSEAKLKYWKLCRMISAQSYKSFNDKIKKSESEFFDKWREAHEM